MKVGIPVVLLALFLSTPVQAQTVEKNSTSEGNDDQPSTSPVRDAEQTEPSITSNQKAPVTLNHQKSTPDCPQPKDDDKRKTCPDGNGKPCAALGGRLYVSDSFAFSQHGKSWSDAAMSRGMLLALGVLTIATVADIETTHSCIQAGTCREGNPLLGQSRAQAYSVAMSANAFAYWAAADRKRHGHGVMPFFVLWGGAAMHSMLAVHNSALTGK